MRLQVSSFLADVMAVMQTWQGALLWGWSPCLGPSVAEQLGLVQRCSPEIRGVLAELQGTRWGGGGAFEGAWNHLWFQSRVRSRSFPKLFYSSVPPFPFIHKDAGLPHTRGLAKPVPDAIFSSLDAPA